MDENETICEYFHSTEAVTALWVDGPLTCFSALISTIGTGYAIRFLRETRLNENMAAALYSLCVVDFLVMMTQVLFLSVEATSILFTGANLMYNKQNWILVLYGMRNSLVMCSTMLVIYITYIRFRVVTHPLKFASSYNRSRRCKSVSKLGNQNSSDISKCSLSYPSEVNYDYQIMSTKSHYSINFRKSVKPFGIPVLIIIGCFLFHSTCYMEFTLIDCYDVVHSEWSMKLYATTLKLNDVYQKTKAAFTSLTETIGPMVVIAGLSLFTEYRIHVNVQMRKQLFESQQRNRESDDLKDKVSKALAVFIVIKFLIFRSLPTFIDCYALRVPPDEFGPFMSALTRTSDFLVVSNSATNTFAYFGKDSFEKCFQWFEVRFCTHIWPPPKDEPVLV
ncbi:unnamed protein product [Caenorhabditis angaria]|uniref:G-protein coupled receptors family 1 profile domain-containing protein n=1 Tax=Caenorhabditis angaria TaxID=860376 RepID=A0A9P1N8J1_9PELO|nr:unnamed protein product [Caenorhabditis angaria]